MGELPKIPRGQIIGQPNGWVPESEADHYAVAAAAQGGTNRSNYCGLSNGWSGGFNVELVERHRASGKPLPCANEEERIGRQKTRGARGG